MVALKSFLPQDDSERFDVARILQDNPDIRRVVEKIAGHAATQFLWTSILLDTRQYDDWDPPLRMTITVPYIDREEWSRQYREFVTWLTQQADYDLDRLTVMVLPHSVERAGE